MHTVAGMEVDGDGPLVVREKVHAAVPMTLDQACSRRWSWSATTSICSSTPSTGSRAWSTAASAYDYGVIRLDNSHLDGEAVNGAARDSGILVESAH